MNWRINNLDLAIMAIYLVGITALGIYSSRRQRTTSSEYFLADRSLGWGMIGAALFATNISTVHLVGLASNGYQDGLVYGNFEWMAPFCLLLLGMVFAPFYFRNRIATLPEYLERRYSPMARTILAVLAIVGALFIHIGVSLYSGAVIFQSLFGMPMLVSLGIVSGLTVLYTVLGGLKAVVVTETAQTALLLFGATVIALRACWALSEAGIHTWPDFAAAAGADRLSMLHSQGNNPWWGFVLGYPVLGIWYWCADQTIVQRVLAARTERDARLGPIFCGFIKVLPVFLMVMPGVIAAVLFREQIGNRPDETLTVLIDQLLPVGLKGLVCAGLLAALMSTVAGALNSTSTLVSIDIAQRLWPRLTDRSLVRIGRITACVVMVLAMAWSTQGGRFGGIFAGLNAMIACLAPPITAVFLAGVLWPRGTSQAALATLVLGFLLGGTVFVLDFPAFGMQILTLDYGIPFLMQAWWLFVICAIIFVAVSLLTPAPHPEKIAGLCWTWQSTDRAGRGDWLPWTMTAALLLVMGVLYWMFA